MGIEQFEIRHSESDTINLIMYPPPSPPKILFSFVKRSHPIYFSVYVKVLDYQPAEFQKKSTLEFIRIVEPAGKFFSY